MRFVRPLVICQLTLLQSCAAELRGNGGAPSVDAREVTADAGRADRQTAGDAGGADTEPNNGEQNAIGRGGWDRRYLSYRQRYRFLVGFDLQQLSNDPTVDYVAWIDFIAAKELNKVRLWLYTSWFGTDGDAAQVLHPWKVVEVGGKRKFDLDNWDPAFWTRLNQVVAYARSKQIIVELSLFAIQEPINYFTSEGKNAAREYAFRDTDNIQKFGRPGSDGDFYPEFFQLDYQEGGRKLIDYQQALVAKAIEEMRPHDNVVFELMNEAPGPGSYVKQPYYRTWASHLAAYIKQRSSRLFTVSAAGYLNLKAPQADFDAAGAKFWNDPNIDGLSFHLYASSAEQVSKRLTNHHRRGKLLVNNESGAYYDREANGKIAPNATALAREIRHGWGHVTAGSYFLAYHGPVEQVATPPDDAMGDAMQAMRRIVESIPLWWDLRPVRSDGSELDDIVKAAPSGVGMAQVLADPGKAYVIYLSGGGGSGDAVVLDLPAGSYQARWYDTRRWRSPLATASVSGGSSRAVVAPASGYSNQTGLVLVLLRR